MTQPVDPSRLADWKGRAAAAVSAGKLTSGTASNLDRWLSGPQYARYQPRIGAMIEGQQWQPLDQLFWEVVPFGTGGRRGPMAEFGSATINERTVAESAWGLGEWLRRSNGGAAGGKAVIAHDTRNRSSEFARLAACVLAAQGLTVFLFEGHRSTPELSFAVRHLGCDVGAMISASHNPPADNGFKAYWSHGGQVLAPHDKGIIGCVYEAAEIEIADYTRAVAERRIRLVGEELDRAYIDAVAGLSLSRERDVSAIFTPLHGVGETSVSHVLEKVGFTKVEVFEPQRRPDGNFPNVPDQLPNPERTQVFAPAIERARETGAELILASDPDADRLGVVVRSKAGEFVHLTGNRVGALVVDYVLRKRAAAGTLSPKHYVIETLVTTPLISAIARAAGVRAIDDLLVGFKYIGQTMDAEGPDLFVFGAEESLGYLAGQYARDKDAAVAALYMMELTAELRREKKTLLDQLDSLFVRHGYFIEDQFSETCKGSSGRQQIEAIMRAFAHTPPTQLSGLRLSQVKDYVAHEVRRLPDNTRIADLPKPAGDLLMFETADGPCRIRFAARPSGTEPKIKFYFFGQAACDNPATLAETRTRTDAAVRTAMKELSDWVRGVAG